MSNIGKDTNLKKNSRNKNNIWSSRIQTKRSVKNWKERISWWKNWHYEKEETS